MIIWPLLHHSMYGSTHEDMVAPVVLWQYMIIVNAYGWSGTTDVINSVQRMRQNARKASIGDRINPLQCIRASFKDDKLWMRLQIFLFKFVLN